MRGREEQCGIGDAELCEVGEDAYPRGMRQKSFIEWLSMFHILVTLRVKILV